MVYNVPAFGLFAKDFSYGGGLYSIQFCGAARTVTGSMHLLNTPSGPLLLECGLFQGRRALANDINGHFPFDPASIQAVVLSHAHLDHCGNLPTLVKKGFRGRIYASPATVDLAKLLLMDSGFIQESDVQFLNKHLAKKGQPLLEPLYTVKDAEACLPQFQAVPMEHDFEPIPGVTVRFHEAGHILGSAMVSFRIGTSKLFFTGDLGRAHAPLLPDPWTDQDGDVMICESTYGDRLHGHLDQAQQDLAAAVQETVRRKSKLVIPAFAVGRTQEVLYYLAELHRAKAIPAVPVYVDSPLAVEVTEVFQKYAATLNPETQTLLQSGNDPFHLGQVHYIRDAEESKRLNTMPGPMVIMSASGMCEAGRILHHLRNSVDDAKNIILFIGYQAENTLGRRLADGVRTVKILGEEHTVKAEVRVLSEFSAHADYQEIVAYFTGVRQKPLRTFLVHGDEPSALSLQAKLTAAGVRDVQVPRCLERFDID